MSPDPIPRRDATLLAIRGPLTGARIPITGEEFVIGRAPECSLLLEDAAVSRRHALLRRRSLAWLLEDLGSLGGTRHNRRMLKGTVVLAPNDEIEIGGSVFLFDSDFDLQNSDFTDRSVYFAGPTEDTVELSALHAAPAEPDPAEAANASALETIADLTRLFDAERHPMGEALNAAVSRVCRLFGADVAMLALWESATGTLRPAVTIAPEDVLADVATLRRVFHEKRAVLVSDRPRLAPHPAPNAPKAPATRSLLAAPVLSEGHALGVICVERHVLDGYTLMQLRTLQSVGLLLGSLIEVRQRAEVRLLRARFDDPQGSTLIGSSPAFRAALDMVRRVAPTPATVLLMGETGTGKEVMAREVHRLSGVGATGPFVAVNCAAIPESLFESELFGHERGAFTGAIAQRRGYIEQAHGGTLFLDEIGELSPAMQPKFLRFLQEQTFSRVGGSKVLRSQVRVVAATNRDLQKEVAEGRFREDLYHRLAVLPVKLPSLRERRADIRLLAEAFAQRHARAIGREIVGISDDAIIQLEKYEWPGNIRELSNCVERAVLLCDGKVLLPRHFILAGGRPAPRAEAGAVPSAGNDLRPLDAVEREHVLRVLRHCDGNQVKAAEILGIHRNTLRKRLQDWGELK
jgi:transcriptional regulator with GAF, ATPase, and Fis domain